MLSVDLGAAVTLTAASTLAGTASLTVTDPAGGTQTPAVTDTGTTHTAVYTPTQAGRYLIAWAIPGGQYTDVIHVWPTDPRFIIGLDEARASLNKTTTPTPADDDLLRLYIAAATPIIEDICGPLLAGLRTQTADATRDVILLTDTDVTIVSVNVDGAALPATAYTVAGAAGVLTATGQSFGGTVATIVYRYGSNVIPPNVRRATAELVRMWWQVGKQGSRPTGQQAGETMSWTPSGFAVPKRVIELCAPNSRTGDFA